jgi:hypothetical protein
VLVLLSIRRSVMDTWDMALRDLRGMSALFSLGWKQFLRAAFAQPLPPLSWARSFQTTRRDR